MPKIEKEKEEKVDEEKVDEPVVSETEGDETKSEAGDAEADNNLNEDVPETKDEAKANESFPEVLSSYPIVASYEGEKSMAVLLKVQAR